jgi:predicted nucleotidyltransferase
MDAFARRLLAEHSEIEEIIVFGSFTTGTYVPGRDLDIFILLSSSPHSIRDRIPGFLPDEFPVPVDLFPFTRDEVAARMSSSILEAVNRSSWRYQRAR